MRGKIAFVGAIQQRKDARRTRGGVWVAGWYMTHVTVSEPADCQFLHNSRLNQSTSVLLHGEVRLVI